MNLTFRIEYRTTWGECLYVVLNNEIEVELSTTDGHLWQGSCEYLPAEEGRVIAYSTILGVTFRPKATVIVPHSMAFTLHRRPRFPRNMMHPILPFERYVPGLASAIRHWP